MPKILTGKQGNIVGRPGGWTGLRKASSSTRKKIVGGRENVRRLFARNPSKGVTANIGTRLDVMGSANQKLNMVGSNNPEIQSVNRDRQITGDRRGRKHVVSRATNRSLKKR